MKFLFSSIALVVLLAACSSGGSDEDVNIFRQDTTVKESEVEDVEVEETVPADTASLTPIETIKMGMTGEEVVAILGEPTLKETISADAKQGMEEWWYGDNQKIRMIKGKVNRVVLDVAHEQEILKKLVEAKKKGDEEEVKRLMEEITKGTRY